MQKELPIIKRVFGFWQWAHPPTLHDSHGSQHSAPPGQEVEEGRIRRVRAALEQNSYADAKRMLKEFEHWPSQINESAAESLREAREEI